MQEDEEVRLQTQIKAIHILTQTTSDGVLLVRTQPSDQHHLLGHADFSRVQPDNDNSTV